MERNETMNMPVLALRGLAIFPGYMLSFDVEREISIRALERAMERDQYIFLAAQRETSTDQPGEQDLYSVGTMSVIRQILRIGDSAVRVMMEGRSRRSCAGCGRRSPISRATLSPWQRAGPGSPSSSWKPCCGRPAATLRSTPPWLPGWGAKCPLPS